MTRQRTDEVSTTHPGMLGTENVVGRCRFERAGACRLASPRRDS